MCGRFVSRMSASDLAAYFMVDEAVAPDLGARYNVAPTDEVYVVAETKAGVRRLGTARWGLVPFWADGPEGGAKMINARAETLLSRSAFRRTFSARRCIVPADGFYEWAKVAGGKQPWHIHRSDGEPFAFAGLWESWRPKDDVDAERLVTCSIITTAANGVVAPLHDRMPVVLPADVWEPWLDPANDDVGSLQTLLVPAPDGLVVREPVSRAVNSVRNDGPELLAPAEAGADVGP
ncbi:MAG: SOS response-associated peptidase [Acidobacteria bacterium]|nr:SOS response-associated peptidase [Acidobacteriota bacterium]